MEEVSLASVACHTRRHAAGRRCRPRRVGSGGMPLTCSARGLGITVRARTDTSRADSSHGTMNWTDSACLPEFVRAPAAGTPPSSPPRADFPSLPFTEQRFSVFRTRIEASSSRLRRSGTPPPRSPLPSSSLNSRWTRICSSTRRLMHPSRIPYAKSCAW